MHINITTLKILFVYLTDSSSPLEEFTSQNNGINAVPKDVPIAVNITAGIFIATKKASLVDDAPYADARVNSLPNPNILATNVAAIKPIAAFATFDILNSPIYHHYLYLLHKSF